MNDEANEVPSLSMVVTQDVNSPDLVSLEISPYNTMPEVRAAEKAPADYISYVGLYKFPCNDEYSPEFNLFNETIIRLGRMTPVLKEDTRSLLECVFRIGFYLGRNPKTGMRTLLQKIPGVSGAVDTKHPTLTLVRSLKKNYDLVFTVPGKEYSCGKIICYVLPDSSVSNGHWFFKIHKAFFNHGLGTATDDYTTQQLTALLHKAYRAGTRNRGRVAE